MIHFDIANLLSSIKKLELEIEAPDFWNNPKESTKTVSYLKQLKNKLDAFNKLESSISNLLDLNDLLNMEEDQNLVKELLENTNKLEMDIDRLEVQTLLSGKYDKNNAIITLHPGARRN